MELPAQKIYTVTELNSLIKQIVETNFYTPILVRGELSNVKFASTGTCFFSLKEKDSLIKCVMFKNAQRFLKFKLEDGIEVIVFGRLRVFTKSGEYNLIADAIKPEKKGELQIAFEQLKAKLEKEGLFHEKYKKSIPKFPYRIGVITSPTGAAIRDIINVITRRFARVNIIIYPAIVQGEEAVPTLIKGIEVFNKFFPVDVIILARGGGSIEDLWAFNSEELARAIFNSKIPIVSAVGHEVDFTIADFVADKRAPTPSAAAEIVTTEIKKIEEMLEKAEIRLVNFINGKLSDARLSFDLLFERFKNLSGNILTGKRTKLLETFNSLINIFRLQLERRKNIFETLEGKLKVLSPYSILDRGYSITFKLPEQKVLKESGEVDIENDVRIKLKKGELICRVREIK